MISTTATLGYLFNQIALLVGVLEEASRLLVNVAPMHHEYKQHFLHY